MSKKITIASLAVLSFFAASVALAATVKVLTTDDAYRLMKSAFGGSASQLDSLRKSGSAGLYGLVTDEPPAVSTTTIATSDLASTSTTKFAKINALNGILAPATIGAALTAKEKAGIKAAFNDWYLRYCETTGKTAYKTTSTPKVKVAQKQAAVDFNTAMTNAATGCRPVKTACMAAAKSFSGFTYELYQKQCELNYSACEKRAQADRAAALAGSWASDVMGGGADNAMPTITSCTTTNKFAPAW